ncbi:MAG TPA: STAS domain-containing protein [Planctomycetota bacterium]|nr:STAS domain-containing protein [Planctomycetota bacterium]
MQIRRRQGITLIRLNGADLADPLRLHQRVEAAVVADGDRKLLVDLSAVTDMNSTQIGAVVGLHVLAYENLAVVKFVGMRERIVTLFRLLGVDTLLDMHYARATGALASFGVYNPEDWDDAADEGAGTDSPAGAANRHAGGRTN